MAEKVFVGGFASSEYQVNWTANKMSLFYDQEVLGITFVDGLHDPERMASEIDRKSVVTHSGGILAVQKALQFASDTLPLTIQAIAPPIPTSQLVLANRSRRIGTNLVVDSVKHPESARSNFLHGVYVLGEVARHSLQHVGAIPAISKFNSIDAAEKNNSRGIPTGLVMMNNDEFFKVEYEDVLYARKKDVELTHIRGEHCDLICRPAFVLGRIAAAMSAKDATIGHGAATQQEVKLPA